jgi:hypothetical protein
MSIKIAGGRQKGVSLHLLKLKEGEIIMGNKINILTVSELSRYIFTFSRMFWIQHLLRLNLDENFIETCSPPE